ncbi:DUF1501 domain-containing protein [Pseudoduganella danionis]|uniref:DUF1501 domain-containing protein n=1 Tax=Pseudoduganella danionis TaxID=1890295 RepID=UPI0036092805
MLALPKETLAPLSGSSAGHSFGLHPALAPLAELYNQHRLAWIANAGPLLVPSTAEQVINNAVPLPPFLMSHSDQTAMQQGWGGDADASGWGGRGLELMPTTLLNPLRAMTMNQDRTLVLGRNSPVSLMTSGGMQYWGRADLAQPQSYWTQALNTMARWQFNNDYEAGFARNFGASLEDSTLLVKVLAMAQAPKADFASDELANNLRALASAIPVFKSMGYRRQIFLVSWGGFDTHFGQRGSEARTQDSQLAIVGKAVAAFDQANRASGVDMDVTTLMMSDFGRTLRPASGAGSDHAWGNHWFVLGGAVAGGQVVGQFPSLVLGGRDDGDPGGGGRMVPTTSTEQVAATLMQWLGLPDSALPSVFPTLANFSVHKLPILRG